MNTSKKTSTIIKGNGSWVIVNNETEKVVASGMAGVPRPNTKWVSSDRENMPKMGLNGKLY